MLNRVVAFFISGILVNLLLIASPITANAFYQEDTVLKTVLVFNFITGEEPVKNKIIEVLKNNEKAKRIVEGAQKLDALIENLDQLVESNDHFEFFWIPHTKWALTKTNNRTTEPLQTLSKIKHWYAKTFLENYAFGAACTLGRLRPQMIPRLATALPSTGQTTTVNDSYRIFSSKRIVKFVEMEYAIPREFCGEALKRVRQVIETKKYNISFPVEVRFTAKDDLALSTATARPTAYIAVHMFKGMDHTAYFNDVANIMSDYQGRPHWGKMHSLTHRELSQLYPQWNEFLAVRGKLDPQRTFANSYTKQVFGD